MPTTLRRAVDVVCALSVFGLIGGVLYFSNQDVRQRQAVAGCAEELDRFRQTLMYRSASAGPDLNSRGWPSSVDPTWFGDSPPRNNLVTPDRPWVEVATAEEATLKDPILRMTVNPFLASFWYNPYQGIIRARVPVGTTDKKALEMYNTVNGTNLDSIYASAQPPAPSPTGPTGATAPITAPTAAVDPKDPGKP